MFYYNSMMMNTSTTCQVVSVGDADSNSMNLPTWAVYLVSKSLYVTPWKYSEITPKCTNCLEELRYTQDFLGPKTGNQLLLNKSRVK